MLEMYAAVIAVSILTCLVMIVVVQSNVVHPRKSKGRFYALYSVVAVSALCEYLGYVLDGVTPVYGSLILIVKFIEYCCAPSLAIIYCAVLCPAGCRRIKAAFALVGVHALFQLVCLPFGLVVRLDGSGMHQHGPLYPVYMFAYLASAVMLLNEARIFSMRNQRRNRLAPVVILLFSLSGIFLQTIEPSARVSWLTLAIGGVFFYLFYSNVITQTDALTLLLNRHSYESAVSHLDERAALVVFDINDFKRVNDSYGHLEGDRCLRDVGRAIFQTYGKYGSCYRIGGDEFCVILLDSLEGVEELNINFLENLSKLRKDNPVLPEVSIGYAIYNPACDIRDDVFLSADEMMYGRKKERASSK